MLASTLDAGAVARWLIWSFHSLMLVLLAANGTQDHGVKKVLTK